eukprot:CAMPEP_0206148454 /NCGR_PEP_ID=MMETSP1473-20131121/36693_1 /ASSEMBLY_ACC=CAM_ASM_001109 /TAXON_ID=1461547 /ORGANISM="Stichococcus sp, Strain RCC1054" /LENGTH=376 /DNA_ID=CAMNT_0053545797 /DNA_START=199 /DNA_END=1326 /DNA_ORIENTATION=-
MESRGSNVRRPLIVELGDEPAVELVTDSDSDDDDHRASRYGPSRGLPRATPATATTTQTAGADAFPNVPLDAQKGSTALSPSSADAHRQQAAVIEAVNALSSVPSPPDSVFADINGGFTINDTAAAELHWRQSETSLLVLAALLPRLVREQLDWGPDIGAGEAITQGGGSNSGGVVTETQRAHDTAPQHQRRALLVEDVTDQPDEGTPQQQLSAAAVLRACALYRVETALGGGWATDRTSKAVAAILQHLVALASGPTKSSQSDVQHPRIGDGGSSHAQTAGQSPEDTALQTLLMKLLPGLLRLLQPFIQRPRQDCSGLPDPFAGPPVFERAVAARVAAAVVLQLRGVAAGFALDRAWGALHSFLVDSAAPVRRLG